jgi:hypothetical protein
VKYTNGNATVTINLNNGSRIIECDEPFLLLQYPLNIDIRVSSKCAFGLNPNTGKAFCWFCHESATTDGIECDYDDLKVKLNDLPKGIELAIGCNEYTISLDDFLDWCLNKGYVCNVTINQGHLNRDSLMIKEAINNGRIKGLGVSYRSSLKWNIPKFILDYPNTVFHVIAGIDDFNDVLSLKDRGVNKLLVLGEKSFGFNENKVDLTSLSHKQWFWWIRKLFTEFKVVSFDNLALEQLNIKRFFNEDSWRTFYNGEYSFYINAIDKTFSPSSRSSDKVSWNDLTIETYFKSII